MRRAPARASGAPRPPAPAGGVRGSAATPGGSAAASPDSAAMVGSGAASPGSAVAVPASGPAAAGVDAAGRQARHTTPPTASVIPRPISSHHTHPANGPPDPACPEARCSVPVARTRAQLAASPGSTSTTGGPGSSAANAHGDGASVNLRHPSTENGSWTPLMAYARAPSGTGRGQATRTTRPSTSNGNARGGATPPPSASTHHHQAPSPVSRSAWRQPSPAGIRSPEPGRRSVAPPLPSSTYTSMIGWRIPNAP
jgi:hypothetical protein